MTDECASDDHEKTAHKEIFRALVEAQDEGLSVQESRAQIAARFSLTADEVAAIERTGIAEDWPPL